MEVGVDDDADFDLNARGRTMMSIAMDEAYTDEVKGKGVYGNATGITLLKDISTLKDAVIRLDGHVENLNDKLKNQEDKIKAIDASKASYKLGAVAFEHIRQRFFETYRRDVLCLPVNSNEIYLGNNVAHGGDLVSDVRMFQDRVRGDIDVFMSLYGIPVEHAAKLGE